MVSSIYIYICACITIRTLVTLYIIYKRGERIIRDDNNINTTVAQIPLPAPIHFTGHRGKDQSSTNSRFIGPAVRTHIIIYDYTIVHIDRWYSVN